MVQLPTTLLLCLLTQACNSYLSGAYGGMFGGLVLKAKHIVSNCHYQVCALVGTCIHSTVGMGS